MTGATQRRLAIAAALAGLAAFVGANLHLVTVAVRSQPDCAIVEGAPMPASQNC